MTHQQHTPPTQCTRQQTQVAATSTQLSLLQPSSRVIQISSRVSGTYSCKYWVLCVLHGSMYVWVCDVCCYTSDVVAVCYNMRPNQHKTPLLNNIHTFHLDTQHPTPHKTPLSLTTLINQPHSLQFHTVYTQLSHSFTHFTHHSIHITVYTPTPSSQLALIPGASDVGCFAAPTLSVGQLFGWETIMVRVSGGCCVVCAHGACIGCVGAVLGCAVLYVYMVVYVHGCVCTWLYLHDTECC